MQGPSFALREYPDTGGNLLPITVYATVASTSLLHGAAATGTQDAAVSLASGPIEIGIDDATSGHAGGALMSGNSEWRFFRHEVGGRRGHGHIEGVLRSRQGYDTRTCILTNFDCLRWLVLSVCLNACNRP